MLARLTRLPFFVLLMGAGAMAMFVPAAYAFSINLPTTGRAFLFAMVLFLVLTLLLGIATSGYTPRNAARSHLTALLAAFIALPLMLAVPFHQAVYDTSFMNAWFEMVSSFTTTGATLYDNPFRLTPPLHLWRAEVAWLGGFLVWVTAVAILAPMNLGGFEVHAADAPGAGARGFTQISRIADPSERLARFSFWLAPIYGGLTFALAIGLILVGERPYVAVIHAMSTLSTSGITPLAGFYNAGSGFAGEVLVFLFMGFAITRLSFSRGLRGENQGRLWHDPEIRMAAGLVGAVTLFLFIRHFIGAIEGTSAAGFAGAMRALWGALFTVTSFLTTTGFESAEWLDATDWSGLGTPGLILVGLSLIGGGIATTAGGVKLLRVFALLKHGQRELERLIYPSSLAGGGRAARQIRRQGAYVAWIFFMLFTLSVVGVMVALALTGVQFETSMVLSVAALSTTGPLAAIAGEDPISFAGIPDGAKMILAGAMVLGRLEALAIIALFNPELWRS